MINLILGVVQLLSIIGVSVYELRKKSISIFLWGTLLIMFGLPHFIAIITKTSQYDDSIIVKASIFVILFNVLYLACKMVLYSLNTCDKAVIQTNTDSNSSFDIGNSVTTKRRNKLKNIYFILLIISFLILAFYSFKYLGGLSKGSWGAYRNLGAQLGLASLNRYGKYILFASAGISLIFLNEKKYTMALISMAIIIMYAMITGNRIIILPALITLIIKYVFYSHKKISMKYLVALGVMGIMSVFTVYFLRLLRIYGGFINMFANNNIIDLMKQTLEMILGGDGELGLRNAFYHFIYYDNNFQNFNKGHTYIRLLLIAIPTFLLRGIKPPDFAISMGSAWSMNPQNTAYSMHPTLYGDMFANLWWFGILLGVFWAILMYAIDKFIDKKNIIVKPMLMVLFSTVYVIVGRGSVYNGFFIAFLGCIIIIGSNLISRIRL